MMKLTLSLIKGDLKLIFRDKTLMSLFLFTPIFIVLLRFGMPSLLAAYPQIEAYAVAISMFFSIQSSIMFGFITSFLILEEKDENIMIVHRVMPVSSQFFIAYRVLFATALAFLGAFLTIVLSGVAYPGLLNACLVALLFSLIAPIIVLSIASFAKNKVEGMAYFKGVDLLLMLPIMTPFIASKWVFSLGFIPTFWIYKFYESTVNTTNYWFFLICLGIQLVLITFLFSKFRKNVFGR